MVESYTVFDRQGYTAVIYLLPGSPPRICKAFNPECITTHYPVEKAVYERFTAHLQPSSILRYYGSHPQIRGGLVLELAENGNLHKYIDDQKRFGRAWVEARAVYRWADQAAEALDFAHSLNIFNSDIHCLNFLLTHDGDLKVADWAGASIDGSRPQSFYRLRHSLFDADGTDVSKSIGVSVSTEVFAFGTALYYMVTGLEPWPELQEPVDRDEIKRRIGEKEFPDTSHLPVLGLVISNCWHVRFTSMDDVRRAINDETVLSARQDQFASSMVRFE